MLLPPPLIAGSNPPLQAEAHTASPEGKTAFSSRDTYRGYYIDLTAITDRQDHSEVEEWLREQIDIVEAVGLSPRILEFFRTVPIVIDDFACLGITTTPASGEQKPVMASACYSREIPTSMHTKSKNAAVWDGRKGAWSNADPTTAMAVASTGVVMVRPLGRDNDRPVLLHEFLHAYHDHILPRGFENPAALSWFKQATESHLYPADQYLMTNAKEFFAVTASVFLFGKDGPIVRAKIKEAQPDYYKYLVWLFGSDPDPIPNSIPIASSR